MNRKQKGRGCLEKAELPAALCKSRNNQGLLLILKTNGKFITTLPLKNSIGVETNKQFRKNLLLKYDSR